jgi:hypothetical protein
MLGSLSKFLEDQAGVSAEELGCAGYYFEDGEAPSGIEAPHIDKLMAAGRA